jgi:hypothetical protein
MLPGVIRSRLAAIALFAALSVLATILVACGSEEATEVVEGEPAELGELRYNVQITRFLNPDDVEDAEYLLDQPIPEPGKSYLGVFMTVVNENKDEAHESADGYTVVDTVGTEFEPVESESPYALEIGAEVAEESQLPVPDSTAATGPNRGGMLLFLVDDTVSENRPLELEIDSPDGSGVVELDI